MSEEEYFRQLCSNSIDGTLTAPEREQLAAHLATCPACAALERDLRQMRTLLAVEDTLPEGLHETVMQRLQQEDKLRVVQPEKPVRRMPALTMVAAAAVVVLVVLGGGLMPSLSTVGSAGGGAAAERATAARYLDEERGAGGTVPAVLPGADAAAADAGQPQDGLPQPAQTETAPVADASAETSRTLTVPEALRGATVAHCYLAEGGGELPEIGGKLLNTDAHESWFLLDNTMTTLQDTLHLMEDAAYAISPFEGVGLALDSKATSWLLVVVRGD
ncbi:MAG: zf-HC2 domain-containing protein [Eubacteriales bacterium]|nr:zf-HC2 domain-containing protein [Eubacteriales bacterium]